MMKYLIAALFFASTALAQTDWNKPDLSSTKTNFLNEIKALAYQAAKMDYTSATNLPNTALRYNRTSKKFQEWNGTTWNDVDIAGLLASTVTTASIADGAVTGIKGGVPAGTFFPYAGAAAPSGYLLADGTAVSRATYATLFAAISTKYGVGDGSTTFNLPNMAQRFPLGKAVSGTGSTLGSSGGAIDHTHTVPAHYHGMGTGADLNITSSGTHTTAIDHDHASATTSTDGSHQHNVQGTAGQTIGWYESGTGNRTAPPLGGTDFGGGTAIAISNGSHNHTLDLPNFTGNSASTGAHTHASGNFAGSIGLVTGGVSGNAAMTSGTNNPPYLVANYIIKY